MIKARKLTKCEKLEQQNSYLKGFVFTAIALYLITAVILGFVLTKHAHAEEYIDADVITEDTECEYLWYWNDNLNNIACNEPEKMIQIYEEADSYVREDIGEWMETATDEEYWQFMNEYNALLEYLSVEN